MFEDRDFEKSTDKSGCKISVLLSGAGSVKDTCIHLDWTQPVYTCFKFREAIFKLQMHGKKYSVLWGLQFFPSGCDLLLELFAYVFLQKNVKLFKLQVHWYLTSLISFPTFSSKNKYHFKVIHVLCNIPYKVHIEVSVSLTTPLPIEN